MQMYILVYILLYVMWLSSIYLCSVSILMGISIVCTIVILPCFACFCVFCFPRRMFSRLEERRVVSSAWSEPAVGRLLSPHAIALLLIVLLQRFFRNLTTTTTRVPATHLSVKLGSFEGGLDDDDDDGAFISTSKRF